MYVNIASVVLFVRTLNSFILFELFQLYDSQKSK